MCLCAGLVFHATGGGAIEIGIGAINSKGEVVGQYFGTDYVQNAFIRDGAGNLTDFAIKGSQLNTASSVNGTGQVVGSWEENNSPFDTLALERDPSGKIRTFSAPESNLQTNATGVNNNGIITGSWVDSNFVSHGFVR